MNPPGWTTLGHANSSFLLPHMGVHVPNNTVSGVHRFLATPLSVNCQDQAERPSALQPQQVAGDMQHIVVTSEDNPVASNNTPQLLNNVHTPFQPTMRRISLDVFTNWAEPEHQQQQQQQHEHHHHQHQEQLQSTIVGEERQKPQLPQEASANFDASFEAVSETDNVSSADAITHIHSQLQNEVDSSAGKIRSKKRRSHKPQPETWKKNVRKTARAKGETYQSATGKIMPAKQVKEVDCSKCRLRCNESIGEEARCAIFESYWATGSYIRQRDFICSHVIEDEKARSTVKGEGTRKREVSRQYWLPEKSGKLNRVCKSFFLKTLDIGGKTVDCAMKKRQGFGFFSDGDRRGKHEPSNKVSEDKLDFMREHIESFRSMNVSPSKKRKNGRIVLPAEYNIRKMYQMYKEHCTARGEDIQKEHTYRRIFNMEYNITFEEPSKDGVVIRTPADQDKFLNRRTEEPQTSQAAAPMKKVVFKPAEQALVSHQNLVTQHIEQVRIEATQNNQQLMKERNRQLLMMKPPPPQPQTNQQQQQQQQVTQQQPSADTVHSSLQHIITSHAMPQYSSAPPPPHFVLQSNHSSRPLDTVNMSQFSMHPSLLHHHHTN